jgi:methylenetetrahydrofolate dehydrogenase (NADP+) / methenyltetrahydrofolate cyclohydrolase
MILLDGKLLSEKLADDLRKQTDKLLAEGFRAPHLGAILVGDNPASKAYVGNKIRLCDRVGFKSTLIQKPSDITESELIDLIGELNSDEGLDGYIVQLPLPPHLDEHKLLMKIDPEKDVDGFHPVNIGKMTLGLPSYKPATPYGILLLLEHYQLPTQGKNCVVIGRSNIVGTPISILLSRKGYPGDATVTLVHSRTQDIEKFISQADIVIAAIGIPEFVKSSWIKEGAVVIDVGINRVDDVTIKKGYKLVGDVDFEPVSLKCHAITPVPGGVGPMTVMALIKNTFQAYKRRLNIIE